MHFSVYTSTLEQKPAIILQLESESNTSYNLLQQIQHFPIYVNKIIFIHFKCDDFDFVFQKLKSSRRIN